MAAANLKKRVDALERDVRWLKTVVQPVETGHPPWWERLAGTFKDDPVFDQIVEAGEKYRKSLAR